MTTKERKRLVDYLPADIPSADEPSTVDPEPPSDPVEAVFDFPDRPQNQPSVKETVGRMVREVIVPGEPTADEMDEQWAQAEQMEAPAPGFNIRGAFDRGARLSMPTPPGESVDPALTQPSKRRVPRRPTISRPAGSDEFTDLFAAGIITIIAFSLGDEFQPTEDEAKDLARPLGNILARRIDLAKKLGEDSNDIVAFAIAMMAYGVRVGPIVGQKVRTAYDDRQRRTRVDRVSGPGRTADTDGEDSVPTRSDARPSSNGRTSHSAFDAVAQARDAQLRVLGRDIGAPRGGGTPLADNG